MEPIKFIADIGGHGFGCLFLITLCNIDYFVDREMRAYIVIRSEGYAENGSVNCWDRIFRQPFGIEAKDGELLPDLNEHTNFWIIGVFNQYCGATTPDSGYWKLGYNNRQKYMDAEFIDHYRKLVRMFPLQERISSKVSEFVDRYAGKRILGIHKRGRGTFRHCLAKGMGHLLDTPHALSQVDSRIDGYDHLFIASDDADFYDAAVSRYGAKVIFCDDKSTFARSHIDDLNRHPIAPQDRPALLDNLMSEVLILSACDERLLVISNFSIMSLFWSKDSKYSFYDSAIPYDA
jgi:hypothetical protein